MYIPCEGKKCLSTLVDTSDLIGRTFLTEQEDRQKHRVQSVAAIEEHDVTVENNLD
jgi:hypothetical protein